MKKKNGRPVYEPPRARDLSTPTASGLGPLGMCLDGSTPAVETCTNGFFPAQDPSLCSPAGAAPRWAGCANGSIPFAVCSNGSAVPRGG
ncbi:MAG: hypothetical protein HY868_16020 [Chloroflexi bacterium]|nr:hypothetical protein [Chloroflexota bacterium]